MGAALTLTLSRIAPTLSPPAFAKLNAPALAKDTDLVKVVRGALLASVNTSFKLPTKRLLILEFLAGNRPT